MSSAVSNNIPNPLSHKHDGSPHSLSTLSSSPACGSNFSPNQANFSQPNCGVVAASTTSTNSNGNGYQLYGVSPTEGSTASGICSNNNGPMSNVENSLTGNIDNNSVKMKDDFYFSDDMQMTTNISNHDPTFSSALPSTPSGAVKEQLLEEEDEDDSRYCLPPQQHMLQQLQPPMQMQIPPFDQITQARKPLYPINPITDRNFAGRLPYAYNRPSIPYPYPIPAGMSPAEALNRSQAYPPMMQMHYAMMHHPRFMHPQMLPPGVFPPGMMPPHGMMQGMPPIPHPNPPAPPPPQPKPKSRSRKQNNNNNQQQQQQQQQQQLPPPMSMMPPSHLMRPPMDMMRASSSTMGPPDMAMNQNIKINGSMKPPVKRYPGLKVAHNGVCPVCTGQITQSDPGVICTALSQGCLAPFHPRCQRISNEALATICTHEHIEWVCTGCSTKQLIWHANS
uniref:PHD-type domain-containing protein n=1 Tax=Panagrolaimus superbus TaxID=310955 RepID=A0A914Y7X5_9BILA